VRSIDRKTALLVASACAPLLVLLAPVLPPVVQIVPLSIGLAVTVVAYRLGARAGFALYAIVAWSIAAISLSFERRLDSSISGAMGDAVGVVGLCAVLAGAFPRAARYVDRIWTAYPAPARERRALLAACICAPLLVALPFAFGDDAAALGGDLLPIGAGIAIALVAYRSGVTRSFLAYAVVSWMVAAIVLPFQLRLDSPIVMALGDAGFLGAGAALIAGVVSRRRAAT
jgi:hypothetical protein